MGDDIRINNCVNNQFGGLVTVLTCVFRLNKLNAKIIFHAKNTFNLMTHKLCVIVYTSKHFGYYAVSLFHEKNFVIFFSKAIHRFEIVVKLNGKFSSHRIRYKIRHDFKFSKHTNIFSDEISKSNPRN